MQELTSGITRLWHCVAWCCCSVVL